MNEVNIGIQIELSHPDDFLLCKESLTRIGIPSKKSKKLYQTAHILHKKGKYYIVHFKELFTLDGKQSTITEEDIQRRNLIASLLHEWDLVSLVDKSSTSNKAQLHSIKIIPFKEKKNWELISKYTLGEKKHV